ncbi:MAG: helix-turn-helix transcriptional regulator [Kiritimatiellales bacterium]|jgi:DNA-binding Xre family transcriptional regulator
MKKTGEKAKNSGRGIGKDSQYGESFDQFCSELRRKINKLRTERGLTQEDMQEFEISLRQFQRIEKGETKNITLSNLFKLSKALKVSLSDLLDV